MAFAPHIRMTMLGTFGPADGSAPRAESFSYGVNIGDAVGFQDPVDDGNLADDYAADAVAFHGRPGSWISAQAVLQVVKFARIGPDGRYTDDPRIVEVNQAGGGGALRFPFQVALAVSLNTARRGATGRGRFFLPAPTCNLAANTGQFSLAETQQIAASVGQFLNDVNNRPGIDQLAQVAVVASSKGYNSAVTSVRVGTVADTIRSRRTSLNETYTPDVPVS